MTTELAALAAAAGVSNRWQDYRGAQHQVSAESLRAVLAALDLPAGTAAEVRDSMAVLAAQKSASALVTATAGQPVTLAGPAGRYIVQLENGVRLEGIAEPCESGALLPGIEAPGYHEVWLGDHRIGLAVAPQRCFTVQDAAPGSRPWALAAQLYSLRRPGDGGIGDFRALQDLAAPAASCGAAAVAISPAHAQFSADPDRFSPYSPSSRIMLNVLHAGLDWPEDAASERSVLVDWPIAARRRLAALRAAFDAISPAELAALAAFRTEMGDTLETHARFEALHASQFGHDPSRWHWRTWPETLRHPASPGVAEFAARHQTEVAFHAYMQFVADRSLAAAQRAMRGAGMPIGLIADLAVGADSGGSHCWSRQAETLLGLSIGAPPDLLATQGQKWGLAAFSPRGLVLNGFSAFIEMLRQAMRHAGGVRIDHALGLNRLWVVPEGGTAADGAYLNFPLQDMLRLIALESQRNRAIVLGEDLGTIPEGFQARLAQSGVLGMRVLWFERDGDRFTPPQEWTREAAAMTSTHDLPTVAGWWAGRDLEWRARLGLSGGPAQEAREGNERFQDRFRLWDAFRASGAAAGEPPPNDAGAAVADAATSHVAASVCDLAIIPLEDALALPDPPNLPGTQDHQHPNWRRRMPSPASEILSLPGVAERLAGVNRARSR